MAPTRPGRSAALGAAVFTAGAVLARRGDVSQAELRWFHLFNRAPRAAHGAVWPLMQLGSLAGLLAIAAGVAASGRQRLGRDLAVWGSGAWLAAKVVKHPVGRGRPASAVAGVRLLGAEQRGLGYPSGHAAVAATLYTVAAPELPAGWRGALAGLVAGVGLARVYVGAHLPLDVIGGFALGAAVGAGRGLRPTARRWPHGPVGAPLPRR